MRGLIVALAVLVATPAVADDLRNQLDGRHQQRAFWLHDQAWPLTRPDASSKSAPSQFTTTYTAGIASRIKVGPGGRLDLFESKLGGGSGSSGPAFVGSVQNGAAMVSLRWNPGQ